MAPSVFLDNQEVPSAKAVASALGDSELLWDGIRDYVVSHYKPVVQVWGYAGKQYGWSLGLKQKKRSVAYLIPGKGNFVCSLAFNEKAVAQARKVKLPVAILNMIDEAKRFPEGRAVRVEINSDKEAAVAKQLIDLKMSCI